ncbi:MAG: hypothetical protein IJA06_04495 [Oscillospiraceae bacterium]|nr:hypothetical protein [Oscillospiraceae bacterium]
MVEETGKAYLKKHAENTGRDHQKEYKENINNYKRRSCASLFLSGCGNKRQKLQNPSDNICICFSYFRFFVNINIP